MRRPGLRPLRETLPGQDADQAAEARLRPAWTQLLGPAMAQRALLLRVRRGALVLGCPDPALLSGLRQSVTTAWPDLRARIQRLTGISLATVQVTPCDHAPAAPPAPKPEDPLAEVLRLYRHR